MNSKVAGESMEDYFSHFEFPYVPQYGLYNSNSQDHKVHLEQNKV